MNGYVSSLGLTSIEWLLCVAALLATLRRNQFPTYKMLSLLLVSRVGSGLLLYPLLLFAGRGVPVPLAYKLYFFVFWASFALEAVLSLLIIYSLFNLAMAPLKGIREMGEIVFRWAAVVSVSLTAAVSFIPHPIGAAYATAVLTELQRAQGVLTLCLLLFVSAAIRPLGLTYRSRPFGVILGLGILATANLVSSGWLVYSKEMYTTVNTVRGEATCLTFFLWIVYFSLREPKRSIVTLPTTSPYLKWNQVAVALGDPPGFVAIAGVPPELFAPAELEMLRLASVQIGITRSMSLDPSRTA